MNGSTNQLPRQESRDEAVITALNTDFHDRDENMSPWVQIRRQWKQILKNFQVLLSPGDKQYRDLPKRVRLMVVSFVVPCVLFVLKAWVIEYSSSLLIWGSVSTFLAIATYAGTIWGLKSQVRKESYYSVLPLGAVYAFVVTLFISVIFTGVLNRVYLWVLFVIAIAVFMISMYILLLAINILNVNLFYSIPLSRLGESITYIFSVVTIFLLTITFDIISVSLFLTYNWLNWGIVGVVYIFITFLVTASILLYFLPLTSEISSTIVSVVALISVVNLVLFVTLSSTWAGAISVAVLAYVLYGYLIHKQQNTMKNSVQFEFLALISAVLVLVLIV